MNCVPLEVSLEFSTAAYGPPLSTFQSGKTTMMDIPSMPSSNTSQYAETFPPNRFDSYPRLWSFSSQVSLWRTRKFVTKAKISRRTSSVFFVEQLWFLLFQLMFWLWSTRETWFSVIWLCDGYFTSLSYNFASSINGKKNHWKSVKKE